MIITSVEVSLDVSEVCVSLSVFLKNFVAFSKIVLKIHYLLNSLDYWFPKYGLGVPWSP